MEEVRPPLLISSPGRGRVPPPVEQRAADCGIADPILQRAEEEEANLRAGWDTMGYDGIYDGVRRGDGIRWDI